MSKNNILRIVGTVRLFCLVFIAAGAVLCIMQITSWINQSQAFAEYHRAMIDWSFDIDFSTGFNYVVDLYKNGILGTALLLLGLGALTWLRLRKEKWRVDAGVAIKEQRAAYIFLIPAFLGLTFITYLPILAALFVGFTDMTVFSMNRGDAPNFVGLDNFINIFTNPSVNFLNSILVTVYFALFAVVSSVVYSLFIAVLLNRKMPGRTFLRAVFYIPYILPAAATMISWHFLLRFEGGLVNFILVNMGLDRVNFLASAETVIPSLVMIAVWASGNLIVIFLAGLQNVPRTYLEAAEVDGANFWQRFWKITIPCITPIIFFNMLMALVVSLQVVVPALTITRGGPGQSSMFMTFLLYHFGPRTGDFAIASAMSFVFFVISAILAAVIFLTSRSWIFYEGGDEK